MNVSQGANKKRKTVSAVPVYLLQRKKQRYQKAIKKGLFGPTKTAKLRWCEGASINPGIGGAAAVVVSANSIANPTASTSHQPMGYDQMMALYRKYQVQKVKLTVDFYNADSTQLIAGISVSRESSFGSPLYQGLIERGDCKYVTLSPDLDNKRIVYDLDVTKFLQLNAKEDDLSATISQNPNEMLYFHIWMAAVDTSVDPAACSVLVTAEYHTKFFEVQDITQS